MLIQMSAACSLMSVHWSGDVGVMAVHRHPWIGHAEVG
jgi:hypothetical protein